MLALVSHPYECMDVHTYMHRLIHISFSLEINLERNRIDYSSESYLYICILASSILMSYNSET